jgi:predicted lipoprotein with Yx(FWY)xxD motif
MTPRTPRPLLLAGLLVGCGLAAAGCGGSSYGGSSTAASTGAAGSTVTTSAAAITTGTVTGLGPVLEDNHGRVLYIYTPDGTSRVTCTGQCAAAWPPVIVASGAHPSATGAAQASLVGTLPDPAGGAIATYAGHPLYTYAGDSGPGVASGQGSGGVWYVITPGGTPRDAS